MYLWETKSNKIKCIGSNTMVVNNVNLTENKIVGKTNLLYFCEGLS